MNFLRNLFRKKALMQDRSPRVRLLLSDGARFECAEGIFPVLNLSESGLSVMAEGVSLPTRVEGKLVLGEEAISVNLEIVRRNGGQMGARFLSSHQEVKAALRRQFSEEIHATEMSEVSPRHLKPEAHGAPRWYFAAGNYELFYLEYAGQVTRVELEWNGRVMIASQGQGPRTGLIRPEDREAPSHSKSALVQWETEVAEVDCVKAVRIVENIPGLDPVARGQIVSLVRGGRTAKGLS